MKITDLKTNDNMDIIIEYNHGDKYAMVLKEDFLLWLEDAPKDTAYREDWKDGKFIYGDLTNEYN